MGHEILNRNGFPSNRNKSKPFRPPRVIEETNEFHPMDYMKLTAQGKHTISNGSFGQKVSGSSTNHISLVKKTPGRSRPGRKNKNVSRMFAGNQHKEFDFKTKRQILELRNDLLSYKCICKYSCKLHLFNKNLNNALNALNQFIKEIFNNNELKDIYSKDIVRESSLSVRVKKQSIDITPVKSIDQRIAKAMTIIQFSNIGRKEKQVINKRE